MATQPIDIRTATTTDVPAIVDLYNALSQEDAAQRDPFVSLAWAEEHGAEHFTELVTGEASVCFVAQAEGAAIGYLAGYTYGPGDFRPIKVAELQSMFVNRGGAANGSAPGLWAHLSHGPAAAARHE
jgi:hypothetical protein